MLRTSLCVLLIALAGCASTRPAAPLRPESLTHAEAGQVELLLETLYGSFSHGDGEEPDWASMRSVFVEGAQVVTEPPVGGAPSPRSVDAFIASWMAAVRDSDSPARATDEWILDTRMVRLGKLIRVDVVFNTRKRADPGPRTPGLDSLVLVEVDGAWKVLSFVVHHEPKLQARQAISSASRSWSGLQTGLTRRLMQGSTVSRRRRAAST